ncbi:MAG: hypothetical protein NTZ31_07080 [Actinobacteria bacterium]|jgi:hypothetical protein|nr:hypothetical protein [Actinomycetota bacterium]
MASGFIYLIILGMWVAYFLPRWITSHEDASGKSAERYKSAMRLVSDTAGSSVPDMESKLNKKAKIAQRRLIFSALSILFLTVSLGVAIGFISSSILAIPTSAVAIYLVHVRRQVVADQLRARRLKALAQISTAQIITEPIEKVTFSSRVDFKENLTDHWIPLIDRIDSAGVVVIPKDGTSWQPTAVPKPTYVNAPKAVTPKRVIDLTVPGAWSAAQEADLLPSRDELFDQELAEEAAIESGRVVNE